MNRMLFLMKKCYVSGFVIWVKLYLMNTG